MSEFVLKLLIILGTGVFVLLVLLITFLLERAEEKAGVERIK
jgi:hydrogenase-4 membrane subunit HyfE